VDEDLLGRLDREAVERLWIVYADYSGVTHAKIVPRERFPDAVKNGVGFANANMDFNILDHQVAEPELAADTGDCRAVPDAASVAPLPYAPGHFRAASFLCNPDGTEWAGCPRSALQRIVRRYHERGLLLRAAFEPECHLFKRIDGEVIPADNSRMFSVDGLNTHLDLIETLMKTLGEMGLVLEQVGAEYGPGQYEINLKHAEPMRAADDLLTLKDIFRTLARRAGLIASFMPKPFSHLPGSGLHVHIGVERPDGKNVLQGEGEDRLSPEGRAFVGGLLAHARGLSGLGAPTVNSYKRLLPGSWSPAHIAFGLGNRAALVRIPDGEGVHVEFRAGDNTSNPHLFLAGLLAAGLDGMERGLDPGEAVHGDIGHWSPQQAEAEGIAFLPRSAREALDAVAADAVLMDALGPVIGPAFLRVKRSEVEAYDLEVTDWERTAYLESV
jgi:glutamine synthetase